MERPIVASGLVLFGGFVLFLAGFALAVSASTAAQSVFYSVPTSAAWVGGLGAFFGFVLFLLGIYLLLDPPLHRAFGVTVVVLSLLTLGISFGFLIEVILPFIGGILAIIFKPNIESRSMAETEGRSRPSA